MSHKFYAKVSFDKKPLGTYVIDLPDEVSEEFIPVALIQAETRIVKQNLRVDLMTEQEYLREIGTKTKIEKQKD